MPRQRVGAPPASDATTKSPAGSIRLDADLVAAVDAHAAETGGSRNEVLRQAVADYVVAPPGMVAPRRPYASGQRKIVWIPGPGQREALAELAAAYTAAERAENPRAKRTTPTAVMRRAVLVYLARLGLADAGPGPQPD